MTRPGRRLIPASLALVTALAVPPAASAADEVIGVGNFSHDNMRLELIQSE